MAKDNLEFNFSYDDFGDQSSYIWSERKGREYLADVEERVHKFYDLYIRSRHVSNHIDLIFAKMNWVKRLGSSSKSSSYGRDTEIMTFHSSPLNIAFSAIFAFLENALNAATVSESSLSRRQYFDVNKAIGTITRESMCGMYSIDSMDYVLALCHFKRVIHGVNAAFSLCNDLLSSAKEENDSTLASLITDLRIAMFDIRELSWQAMSFCNSMAE